MRHLLFFTSLLLAAAPASAFEGRVQISAAPFTISASGSYALTGNLTVSSSQTAITVNADYVTIDLNGFAIVGPNTCSFALPIVTCTA
jgi:lipopolysaccharide export system protein LptA